MDANVTASPLTQTPNYIPPTVQSFLGGSGTYCVPQNPKPLYLRVKLAGGGAGGSGSSTVAANDSGGGGLGGNTFFGTSFLIASGAPASAGGRSTNPTLGGTGIISFPAIPVVIQQGGAGQATPAVCNASDLPGGGSGGTTPFGGAGGGGNASGVGAGNAGIPNTGAGGGGAGGPSAGQSGNGGSAGGYIEAIIPNPAMTYAYGIGSGGTGGNAGTSGNPGGVGGAGIVIVEEHYQ